MHTEDALLFNETLSLGQKLWTASTEVSGLPSDPKMVSIILYRRLWSHHRGYAVLNNSRLDTEADTILRSSFEAAICIAANYHLPDGLYSRLQQDALHTLQAQVRQFRESGDLDMVRESEEMVRFLLAKLPEGEKSRKLEMKSLAEIGKVNMLYRFYRTLSGQSSHVTGLSIMRGLMSEGSEHLQKQLEAHSRTMRPLWEMAAFLQGFLFHSLILGQNDLCEQSIALAAQLNGRLDETM